MWTTLRQCLLRAMSAFVTHRVHIATAGLLFRFVRRHTDSLAAAVTAAGLFGVSAAYVPTVAYATAFTHVFGTFLVMLALVTIDEALDHEHPELWRAASVVFFALAVMANEPVAVIAPPARGFKVDEAACPV